MYNGVFVLTVEWCVMFYANRKALKNGCIRCFNQKKCIFRDGLYCRICQVDMLNISF